jgi:hypothetical protein
MQICKDPVCLYSRRTIEVSKKKYNKYIFENAMCNIYILYFCTSATISDPPSQALLGEMLNTKSSSALECMEAR